MCLTKYLALWPSQTEAFFLNHHTKPLGMTKVKASDDCTRSMKVKLGLGEQLSHPEDWKKTLELWQWLKLKIFRETW